MRRVRTASYRAFTPSVSISDEKPLHMRLAVPRQAHGAMPCPGLRGIQQKCQQMGRSVCLTVTIHEN